ncbi:hypothetical protein HHI36_019553 [Cryptolaemus montrouzieri]|uniref:Protein twisted gastrulation n=1 Tax=Cryptolaemus montrouzieri TaxID=559131 RepID=A0ABD2N8H0_9CUCU
MKYIIRICASIFVSVYFLNTYVLTCNESICGSIVSKCLLLKFCTCTPDNFTCSKQCYHCLKNLYSECCSCVNLCEVPRETSKNSSLSYVEQLDSAIPGLFQALTEDSNEDNWISETYQIKLEITPQKTIKIDRKASEKSTGENQHELVLNCTVAFQTGCTSITKCRNICSSMGATGYRWFHDGCCECVGENCLNFGLNENKCRQCSSGPELNEIKDDYYEYEEYYDEEYDEYY